MHASEDPHAHWDLIQALESRISVEECSFNSIFGTFEGHRIYARRKAAEKIEIQAWYSTELYDVDQRQNQRYMAEKDLFPAEKETSPGSLPTSRLPYRAWYSCDWRYGHIRPPWILSRTIADVILIPYTDYLGSFDREEGQSAAVFCRNRE